MKIEDIFKNNLQNSEMPVDSSLWNELNNRISFKNGGNNSANSQSGNISTNGGKGLFNKIASAVKGMKAATLVSVASVVVASTIAAVVIVNNANEKTNTDKNKIITHTDKLVLNTDKIITHTDNTASDNKLQQSAKNDSTTTSNVMPSVDFDIDTANTNMSYSTQNIVSTPEMIATQTPNSVVLNTKTMPNNPNTTSPKEQHNSQRTNSKYEIKILIPNVITPNGDGINDCFAIQHIEDYRDNMLVIYNRNNKVVYQKRNYNNEFCPQNLENGTYFYNLVIRNQGFEKTFQGVITIIE